jgi:AcrR family transcriptional regulator
MSSEAVPYGDPDTRRRILQAAWELLEQQGAGVRLADVADRAGVSRQAVYLHFGDRSGLLVALVDFIDVSLGAVQLRAHIHGGANGVESLQRWIETMSWYTVKIDRVTQVLESSQYQDEALAAAWRDRMGRRQMHIHSIVERIAAEGQLADGWSVNAAVDLIYVITMPGAWRELTRELGWTTEQYAQHLTRLVQAALLKRVTAASGSNKGT